MRFSVVVGLLCSFLASSPALLRGQALSTPSAPSTANDLTVPRCLVAIKDEARVPALVDGLLTAVSAELGTAVSKGDLLASQDEMLLLRKLEAAQIDRSYADKEAGNNTDIDYAIAAKDVAENEYQSAVEANRRVSGTVAPLEVRRFKLQWLRSYLQIKQAKFAQDLAKVKVTRQDAEVRTTETELSRLKIAAPLDGEVVEAFKHAGEWARAGDPVFHVVRFDLLKVDGFLNVQQIAPADVLGRAVTVQVDLAGGGVSLPGRIVHVSSVIEGGGNYRFSAEVANRKERDQWILRPGLTASLTIHFRQVR